MAVSFGHVCSADLHCSVCADRGLKTCGPGDVAVCGDECPRMAGGPCSCPVPGALLAWAAARVRCRCGSLVAAVEQRSLTPAFPVAAVILDHVIIPVCRQGPKGTSHSLNSR